MKVETKIILAGSGIFISGYLTGKVVGYVKCGKLAFDMAEDVFPGTKRYVAKYTADRVIDRIFKDKKEKEESD